MTTVTRFELYTALTTVWLYLMILIGDSLRTGPREWAHIALWLAAGALTLFYAVASWRAFLRGAGASR